jgi:hypothetical protein
MAGWKINWILGSILLDRVHLFLHCGAPCRVSLRLIEGARLTVVEREMELSSQTVRYKPRHQLVAKDICHGSVPEGLAIERVDAVLVMASW